VPRHYEIARVVTCLAALVITSPVHAAGTKPASSTAPLAVEQKTQLIPAPTAIPVPEIVKRAEEVTKRLTEFHQLAERGSAIDEIDTRLPELRAQITEDLDATIESLKREPARTAVDRMAHAWRVTRLELAGRVDVLTKRATQLESALDQLANLRTRWTLTRTEARASLAPPAVLQRADAVLSDIDAMRALLQAQRGAILVLQDQVGQEMARCQDALARIERFQQVTLTRTFTRDTSPIWDPYRSEDYFEGLSDGVGQAAEDSVAVLRQFIREHSVRLLLHGLLFAWLILMARAGRRLALNPFVGERPLVVFTLIERPYSAAAVAALISVLWIYPDRPRLIGDMAIIVGLVPLLRIAQPLLGARATAVLYGIASLIAVDRVRAEFAVFPIADQLILMLEMLAAMVGLAFLLVFGSLRRPLVREGTTARLALGRATAVLAMMMCAASFVAAAFGAMRLARMLGSGLLFSAFSALALYVAVQVLDDLLTFAFRVSPLRSFRMVHNNCDLLLRRARAFMRWSAVLIWAVETVRNVGLLDPLVVLGQAVLNAELRSGAIAISLSDVLAFILTVCLAFIASSLIRFILEEDVYPRLRLSRGLPYIISSLLHYTVLFVGFLLAVSALGVDLNRITILAGAFGVGLGFGLQGLVNNFVSGLIVLFERPIHVGDSIRLGDVIGRVQRIGIRSTTVRTPEGAEVIVPNASLVAEKVTNWTHAGHRRRVDTQVGVAYGNAPDKVLELLRAVAALQPGIITTPPPVALLLGFGSIALNFELRAWTNRPEQWIEVRSELNVAVYAALQAAGIEIPCDRNNPPSA